MDLCEKIAIRACLLRFSFWLWNRHPHRHSHTYTLTLNPVSVAHSAKSHEDCLSFSLFSTFVLLFFQENNNNSFQIKCIQQRTARATAAAAVMTTALRIFTIGVHYVLSHTFIHPLLLVCSIRFGFGLFNELTKYISTPVCVRHTIFIFSIYGYSLWWMRLFAAPINIYYGSYIVWCDCTRMLRLSDAPIWLSHLFMCDLYKNRFAAANHGHMHEDTGDPYVFFFLFFSLISLILFISCGRLYAMQSKQIKLLFIWGLLFSFY